MIPMADYCRKIGVELFIYSRYHVNTKSKLAFGYLVDKDRFVPVVRNIPVVNGYWFYNTIRNVKNLSQLTKIEFIQFLQDENIELYPNYDFSRLMTDKFQTFKLVNQLEECIQPYTEIYSRKEEQIKEFLKRNNKIFFKPIRSSQGEEIFVLLANNNSYFIKFYSNKKVTNFKVNSIKKVILIISENKKNEDYIIQQACDVLHFSGGPFIIRSILLDDSEKWHLKHKVVVADSGNDIANTTQGCKNYTIEEAFEKLFQKYANSYLKKLDVLCLRLVNYFSKYYQDEIMEVAFDFVINKDYEFLLLESDIHPGLRKPSMPSTTFINIFKPSGIEQKIYDQYIKPHGECLAKFLISRLIKKEATIPSIASGNAKQSRNIMSNLSLGLDSFDASSLTMTGASRYKKGVK